jgi:hypothetical protein
LDFSIAWYSREHSVVNIASVSILRWGDGRHLLCWVQQSLDLVYLDSIEVKIMYRNGLVIVYY